MTDASIELKALVIEHLADLEDAYRQWEATDAAVFAAMSAVARAWAAENDWFGRLVFDGNEPLRIAPKRWRIADEGEKSQARAWYYFGHADGDPGYFDPAGDCFDLTRLCQARNGMMGFQVWPEWKVEGVKLAAWKRAARASAAELMTVGFSIGSAGTVFRPVKLDAVLLAKAIRDETIEAALGPWTEALNQLEGAVPTVEAIMKRSVV